MARVERLAPAPLLSGHAVGGTLGAPRSGSHPSVRDRLPSARRTHGAPVGGCPGCGQPARDKTCWSSARAPTANNVGVADRPQSHANGGLNDTDTGAHRGSWAHAGQGLGAEQGRRIGDIDDRRADQGLDPHRADCNGVGSRSRRAPRRAERAQALTESLWLT
jgi:hypothetical protein